MRCRTVSPILRIGDNVGDVAQLRTLMERMKNGGFHLYAVLVAVSTAALLITGPVVSPNEARPLYSLGQWHAWLGAVESVLMLGLAIWLSRRKEWVWLRRVVWVALAANILVVLLGLKTDSALVRIAHTLFGQLFFLATVAVAVFTSTGWSENRRPGENSSIPRFLVIATPALALIQVTLGVAFRQGVLGASPHILGALVFGAVVGPTAALVLRIRHSELHASGIAAVFCLCVQMLLGFALLILQSLEIDPVVMIVATTAHAAIGAFTLAAVAMMAILAGRLIWQSHF